MTYSVFWSVSAIQELARVEQAAANPQSIREAAARMDFALRRYPKDLGESRSSGFRVWYEDLLGLYYQVDDSTLRVDILFVGPTRRR